MPRSPKKRAEKTPEAKWHLTYYGTCRGTTKAGEPCGQSSVYGNAFCRHHGGFTSEEEIAAYKQRILDLSRKRNARLMRRLGLADNKPT